MRSLTEAGVLREELCGRVVFCPYCNSVNVFTGYCCPSCKSLNVGKALAIEHIRCGYIDAEALFHVKEKLVCPKCHEALTEVGVDYRRIEAWRCNDCSKTFEAPVPHYFCSACGRSFTFDGAVCKEVYCYSLSDEVIHEASKYLIIAPVKEFFEKNGFKTESPGSIEGRSTTRHLFDIVASREGVTGNVTVVDLAISNSLVNEQPLIAMFAKAFDTNPAQSILIAFPKLSDTGKKLAGVYKISVVEARNTDEVIKKLRGMIKAVGVTGAEPLDVMTLLSLPDHLRITAMAINKLGRSTAEDVAKETGRARAVESGYLNQLVKLGHLKRGREGHKVYFCIENNRW
ncbi:MAG: hypothetical protein AOA65_1771 [Candidatus Bathyarchaeota archaeon BA1]|nr:MAG: hypothetical protein AOA65_1771 [Candidatus Bathyarchaeota archaeon BA1]